MAITEVPTQVQVGPTYGKKVGNLGLIDAKFWGRPNFRGEENQFKDARRCFTVLIPNDLADQLRDMGWNVKTTIPTTADLEKDPDRVPLSHLKVMVDDTSEVILKNGDDLTTLTPVQFPIVDRTRFSDVGVEVRAWEYDPEEQPGKYSARLVKFVGVFTPSLLQERYGQL